MQGWVSVYRELLDKPIWITSTPEQKTILMTLMLMANHKDAEWEFKGEKFVVKKGQMITSLESIVAKCGKGVTMQNVRTALKRFEKYGFLTNESTNKNRLITLVNWEVYQHSDDETNKQTNKQLTSNQQATNKQLTTNNNNNNKDNVKNELKPSIDFESEFEMFWSIYKKKTDKKNAFAKFKIARKKHSLEKILEGTSQYMRQCEIKNTAKNYIKGPAVFLHGENFNDEFDLVPTTNGNGQTDIFEAYRRELNDEQDRSIINHSNNQNILPEKL